MVKVQTFSKGKTENKNEDYFDYNETCFVIADGATDKSGKKYNDKTGGELVSRIVVKECLSTNLNGTKLVIHLNKKVKELYADLNIINEIQDPKFRFTCGFICIRIIDNKILITYLGDLGFRINGSEIYQETKQIDIDNSEARSKYIRETNDVNGSRNHIMPLLLKQFEYQNNPAEPLGYGVIDGTNTPAKFIKFEVPSPVSTNSISSPLRASPVSKSSRCIAIFVLMKFRSIINIVRSSPVSLSTKGSVNISSQDTIVNNDAAINKTATTGYIIIFFIIFYI